MRISFETGLNLLTRKETLQEEASLEEIVRLVGLESLSERLTGLNNDDR